MTGAAQAEAYAAADFEQAHAPLMARFARLFAAPRRAVDLGCGDADIALRLARLYPHCRIDALDGADAMLRQARRAVAAASLERRVRLRKSILPDPSLPAARYDAVVSNSLLHHLPDPAVLWDAVRRLARPGAAVFVSDLARPANAGCAQALVERHARAAPPVLRRDFYNSLLAAFTPAELRAQLAARGERWRVEAYGDRHLLVWGRA